MNDKAIWAHAEAQEMHAEPSIEKCRYARKELKEMKEKCKSGTCVPRSSKETSARTGSLAESTSIEQPSFNRPTEPSSAHSGSASNPSFTGCASIRPDEKYGECSSTTDKFKSLQGGHGSTIHSVRPSIKAGGKFSQFFRRNNR